MPAVKRKIHWIEMNPARSLTDDRQLSAIVGPRSAMYVTSR